MKPLNISVKRSQSRPQTVSINTPLRPSSGFSKFVLHHLSCRRKWNESAKKKNTSSSKRLQTPTSQQNPFTSRSYAFKLLKKSFVGHKTEQGSKVPSVLWKLLDHPNVSLPTKSRPPDLRSFHTSRAHYNNNPHSRSATGVLAVGGGRRAGWVKNELIKIRSPEGPRRRNSSWNLALWTEQGTGVSFRTFQRRLT